MVRLTERILDLHAKAMKRLVSPVVEIGRCMAEVRDRLPRGEWVAWVAEAVPFERRTIQRYIALFRWSEKAPRSFQRFAHLGPSKLYVLAAGSPPKVAKLRPGIRMRLPGDRRKTIDDMTAAELETVVIGDLTTPPRPPRPIGKVMQKTGHMIEGLEVEVFELRDREREVPPGGTSGLATKLRRLADILEAID